jgi:hypothetical protein
MMLANEDALCGAARWRLAKIALRRGAPSLLIGFVATENVENVKSLANVIELKANPPLPDPQSILREISPDEAPHVSRSWTSQSASAEVIPTSGSAQIPRDGGVDNRKRSHRELVRVPLDR